MNTERDDKLAAAVIQLHDIARMVESQVGRGLLSDDIRDCANRLHMITQPIKSRQEQVK